MVRFLTPILVLGFASCTTMSPRPEVIIYESFPPTGGAGGFAVNIFGDLFTLSGSWEPIEDRLNSPTGGKFAFKVNQGAMLSETFPLFKPSVQVTAMQDPTHNCKLISKAGDLQQIECVELSTAKTFKSEIDADRGLMWFEGYCMQGLGGVCTFKLRGEKGLWAA